MESHQGFVCLDEILGFLGSGGHPLSYVTAKFILQSLLQSDKPILQGSQFLENYTLHVCSCIEWVQVRTTHFHESKRIFSLKCDPQSYSHLDWVSGKVSIPQNMIDSCPACSY